MNDTSVTEHILAALRRIDLDATGARGFALGAIEATVRGDRDSDAERLAEIDEILTALDSYLGELA